MQCTADLLPADVTGLDGLRPEARRVRVPPGTAVCQHRAGRRDQPRHAAHPVGLSRGDGGARRDRRRRHAPLAAAVHAARDAEPGGAQGHLSAARSAGRPLPRCACAWGTRASDEETLMLERFRAGDPLAEVHAVAVADALPDGARGGARRARRRRHRATTSWRSPRPPARRRSLKLGASPRASLFLQHAAQAAAALAGRDYVTPNDVQDLIAPVLAHRLMLSRDAVDRRARRRRRAARGRGDRARTGRRPPGRHRPPVLTREPSCG